MKRRVPLRAALNSPATGWRALLARTKMLIPPLATAILIGIGIGNGICIGNVMAQTLPAQSRDQTLGAVTCASSLCHGAVKRWQDSPVLQNEYVTFTRTDKHARAYKVLLNARSKKIAKNLGLKTPAHEAALCLDCHAHNIPAARRGERFVFEDGITCESCHGPAERWIKPHVSPVGDSAAHHAANVENGLYPASDATARARLCLSCHFGNKDKLVTHRIMGAGHPRMSFELDTFTEIAPKHFTIDKDYGERKKIWDGAKTWAIGQALAVSETMDILADEKRGRDGLFPELVLFDCHACHHPMSESRWKPKTVFGPSASPGLVRLNDANMIMLRALSAAVDPAMGERVRAQAQKLHRAVAGEGDPRIEAAALKALAMDASKAFADVNFTALLVRRVLTGLIDDGLAGHYSDYAAAEQASMAIASVASFLEKQGALPAPGAFNAALKKLNALLANDERYSPPLFRDRLQDLRGRAGASADQVK